MEIKPKKEIPNVKDFKLRTYTPEELQQKKV